MSNRVRAALVLCPVTVSVTLVMLLSTVAGLSQINPAQAQDRGKILAINTDKSTVRHGGTIAVTVKVLNLQRGQHRQLVVVNIVDSRGKAIYDSHQTGEDIDFVIGYREQKIVGPFTVRIPTSASRGTYYVLVGYREHPWDPLIQFRGTPSQPPVTRISVN